MDAMKEARTTQNSSSLDGVLDIDAESSSLSAVFDAMDSVKPVSEQTRRPWIRTGKVRNSSLALGDAVSASLKSKR